MHINLPRHDESHVLPLPRTPVRILVGDPLDLKSVVEAHFRAQEKNSWDTPITPRDEDCYEKVTHHVRLALLDLQIQMDAIVLDEEGPESPNLNNAALYEQALEGLPWAAACKPTTATRATITKAASPLPLPPSLVDDRLSQK
eukprot:CAMPEP_0167790414 /NCGR_PEP_ID=MMETSP0111_2-20121227/11301_1 /TAXON_ID=91324 /ORGANISM="Lotharella globosa, Strain CCCM811" /LENGTH=142 /DNA_ID=CAMNT_0007682837 /DNA_START=377 /DNA_END=805 /DNA_ORIENTATION=-